ncbi:MAG: hypothetical protein FWC85_01535, partial [Elusimicrobia bacterium]|nr:hypothetical protein [Elusimicrobiota bacterium]
MYDFFFGSENTIINIQDMHADYATQRNIADILNYLVQNYNIGTIWLEGAWGLVDINWLRQEPDPTLRRTLAHRLLKDGRISGAEYFKVNNTNADIRFKGVEDETVYVENFELLRQMLENEADNRQLISFIQGRLSQLIRTTYSIQNRRLHRLQQRHKRGRVSDRRYYAALERLARRSDVPFFNFRYIARYNYIIRSARRINYRKLQKELNTAREWLRNNISYSQYRQLSALAQNHPTEYIKRINLYLLNSGKSDKFPSIRNYIALLNIKNSFNYRFFFIQEDFLSHELLYRNARRQRERDLIFLNHFTPRLLNMLTGKLTSEEHVFVMNNFVRYSILLENYIPVEYINWLRAQFDVAARFYENNLERNNLFLSNALGGAYITPVSATGARYTVAFNNRFGITLTDMLQAAGTPADILISGGFHSQGMKDLMNINAVNYAIVMPRPQGFNAARAEYLFKRDFHTKKSLFQNAYQILLTSAVFNLPWENPLEVIFTNFLNASLLDELSAHINGENFYNTLNEYLQRILQTKNITQDARIINLERRGERAFTATVIVDGEITQFEIADIESDVITGNGAPSGRFVETPNRIPRHSIFRRVINMVIMLLTMGIVGTGITTAPAGQKKPENEENPYTRYFPSFARPVTMYIWPIEAV